MFCLLVPDCLSNYDTLTVMLMYLLQIWLNSEILTRQSDWDQHGYFFLAETYGKESEWNARRGKIVVPLSGAEFHLTEMMS